MVSDHPCSPSAADFAAAFAAGQPQIVSATLIADLETPVSAMLRLKREGEPCFLLESVQGGEVRGRYSIIGLMPDLTWRCRGDAAEIKRGDGGFTPAKEGSLASLKRLVRDCRVAIPDGLPPMAAGLVGYLGYDMVKLMERLPDANPDPIGIPDACLMRPRLMLIFDSVKGVLHICAPLWKEHGFKDAASAYGVLTALIASVAGQLREPLPAPSAASKPAPLTFRSNTTQAEYHAMVERAKEHIAAGDIFQIVPSQRFSTPFTLPPFALYRSLRHTNPSPFLFFLDFGDSALIGSSPEILVRLRDGLVTIRPLAGTRRRGENKAQDDLLAAELLSDPKEIAEHLMLLDLGRNDIGRIAKTGTVKVTEQMTVEQYSHVMHIVSNVEGELDPRFDAIDALIAGFPAGTVSGAPKIRAMEIIDALEKERRSFYAGCVGYFSAGGSMDTCITLRTGLIKDGVLYVQAGGGVVADSDPQAEYEESCNKARALMRAAEEAAKFRMNRRNKIEAVVIPCEEAVERYQRFFDIPAGTPDPKQQEVFAELADLERKKHTRFVMVSGSDLDKDHMMRLDGLLDVTGRIKNDRVAKIITDDAIFYVFLPSRELLQTLRNTGLIGSTRQAELETEIKGSLPLHIS